MTTGVDGLLKYVTIAGDLDVAGGWSMQGRAVLASGREWSTSVESFDLDGNL